jgi:hypothetical protein
MRIGKVRLALIGAVLGVIAVAAVAWFAVLSPRLATVSALQEQVTQMQTANLSLRNQYNQALDQAEAAPEAAAEAQVLFARMPQTAELPAILEQITAAATDAGIPANAVTTLTTGIPTPVGERGEAPAGTTAAINLATMEIGVTAQGTRPQVLAFLDNLQALDRSLLVTSTIDSAITQVDGQGGGPDQESMQVGGRMFVLESRLPDLVATVEQLIAEAEAG